MQKIDFLLKNKCGIYMIFNLVNGKRYIGSSLDIYNRLHEHLHNLKNNKSHNKHLQNAWNKYGESSFLYNVLEFTKDDVRFEREQYYIDVISPEYNLTNHVIANTGYSPTEETRNKIANTLKEKYKSGELTAYRQDHLWIKTWIYNIRTFKLEAECECRNDAFRLMGCKKHGGDKSPEAILYKNRYIISSKEFKTLTELVNYINEKFLVANSKFGKYLICEDINGNLTYFRTLTDCARDNFTSKSTLSKHSNASKEHPYIIQKTQNKFYYSNEYIPIQIEAVHIEKSYELLQDKIGEDCDVNTEVNTEIKKSVSP